MDGLNTWTLAPKFGGPDDAAVATTAGVTAAPLVATHTMAMTDHRESKLRIFISSSPHQL
jgi:hypothetical protein